MINLFDYILISLILFSSLYVGKFISIKAKEEVDSGLFWFKLIKLLVYFSVVGYVMFNFSLFVSILVLLIGVIGYFSFDYLFLAFAYALVFDNFVIGLIFVYGLLRGTVSSGEKLYLNIYFVIFVLIFNMFL